MFSKHTFSKAYLTGLVDGIDYRLKEDKLNSVDKDAISALVIYNDKALGEYLQMEIPNVKIAKPRNRSYRDFETYDAGFQKGNELEHEQNSVNYEIQRNNRRAERKT